MGLAWWEWGVVVGQAAVSAVLFAFALHMYWLLILYLRHRRRPSPAPHVPEESLPSVTVQLPICNEKWVGRRVVRAACELDYPHSLLEIQVLDDSTDETTEILEDEVRRQRARGINVSHLRRADRTDYKAGNLRHGLKHCRGEFIAIFDADFVPPPDWLRRTVPELMQDPGLGWVQSRWEHGNKDESWLTRVQAIALDGHFVVEQTARVNGGLFGIFNGSAGLLRRKAIEDAGGWTGDSVNEDVDLSYRAQLKGWRMRYLPSVTVPGEVPAEFAALKAQQVRWGKGFIQAGKHLWRDLWRSKESLAVKIAATFHFGCYAIYLFMLLSLLLTFPMVLLLDRPVPKEWLGFGAALSLVSCVAPIVFYSASQLGVPGRSARDLLWLPVMIVLGMGLSWSISRGMVEALLGKPTPFVRTPKRGDCQGPSGYSAGPASGYLPELLLAAVCCLFAAMYSGAGLLPVAVLHGMYSLGFLIVGLFSWRDPLAVERQAEAPQTEAIVLQGAQRS